MLSTITIGRPLARYLLSVRCVACAHARLKVSYTGDSPPSKDYRQVPADDKYHFATAQEFDTELDSDLPQKTRLNRLSPELLERKDIGIKTIAPYGFRLIDDTFLMGPVALFPKIALSWKVLTPEHITAEAVTLFACLDPSLDILIIGAGDRKDVDGVRKRVAPFLTANRVPFEVHQTEECVAIFNYLNYEGRYVAAALYPPHDIVMHDRHRSVALRDLTGKTDFDLDPATPIEAFLHNLRDVPPFWRQQLDKMKGVDPDTAVADTEPRRHETLAKIAYLLGDTSPGAARKKDDTAERLESGVEEKLDEIRLAAEQRAIDKQLLEERRERLRGRIDFEQRMVQAEKEANEGRKAIDSAPSTDDDSAEKRDK